MQTVTLKITLLPPNKGKLEKMTRMLEIYRQACSSAPCSKRCPSGTPTFPANKGSKKFNRMMSGWNFRELASFIEYKVALAGVPVIYVDPKEKRVGRRCAFDE